MHSARWMMRASVGLATSQLHADAKSNSRRRKDACISGAHLEIDECVVKDQIEGLHPRSDGETTHKESPTPIQSAQFIAHGSQKKTVSALRHR
jgi:hypothetical protein